MNNNLQNMYIDAFYNFTKKEGTKTAFPCTRSTGNYLPFENGRNTKGKLTAYFSEGDYVKGRRLTKKERWKLSIKSQHLSELRTNTDFPTKAVGDVKGTNDLLLFVVNGTLENFTEVRVFVAKGKKFNQAFITAFFEGEFAYEMKQMGERSPEE